MKRSTHLLLTLMLIAFSGLLSAQEVENPPDEFMNNTWYLTKIIFEGDTMPFVPDNDLQEIKLEPEYFDDGVGISLNGCHLGDSGITFDGEDKFFLASMGYLIMDYCYNEENLAYFSYVEYFFRYGTEMQGYEDIYYQYEISTGGSSDDEDFRAMVIKNVDGDKTFYQNEPYLSVSEHGQPRPTVYPNPVEADLYIGHLTRPLGITIYDLNGKSLVQKQLGPHSKKVDVSGLSKGVYLYRLTENHKVVQTGKLVKQ